MPRKSTSPVAPSRGPKYRKSEVAMWTDATFCALWQYQQGDR